MNELNLYTNLCRGIMASGAVTFLILWFIPAPYGRYERTGWGPGVAHRTAWMLMEIVPVIVFSLFFFTGDHWDGLVPLIFFGMFQAHYVDRALIYPFRMRMGGHKTPLVLVLLAMTFNAVNSYVNSRWVAHLAEPPFTNAWLTDPRLSVGVSIFVVGFAVNRHSDWILKNLRPPGEHGYKIPRGGLYRWVTMPNYFGELVEWTGWAIATWSLAGVAFVVYTFANLAPRAMSNQQWYRAQFPDYPKERKILIPYVW